MTCTYCPLCVGGEEAKEDYAEYPSYDSFVEDCAVLDDPAQIRPSFHLLTNVQPETTAEDDESQRHVTRNTRFLNLGAPDVAHLTSPAAFSFCITHHVSDLPPRVHLNSNQLLADCPQMIRALLTIPPYMQNTAPLCCSWVFAMERFCGYLSHAARDRHRPYTHLNNYDLCRASRILGGKSNNRKATDGKDGRVSS